MVEFEKIGEKIWKKKESSEVRKIISSVSCKCRGCCSFAQSFGWEQGRRSELGFAVQWIRVGSGVSIRPMNTLSFPISFYVWYLAGDYVAMSGTKHRPCRSPRRHLYESQASYPPELEKDEPRSYSLLASFRGAASLLLQSQSLSSAISRAARLRPENSPSSRPLALEPGALVRHIQSAVNWSRLPSSWSTTC